MDVAMPVCDGLTATRLVKAELPEIKVIMLSAAAEDHQLFEAVKSGATGYLLKSMDADELVAALHDALNDVPPLAPALMNRVLAEFGPGHRGAEAPAGAAAERLTPRQREVLGLLAEGLSYREVAERVFLTPRTAKYHAGEIMRRLHLRNRAQVLAYAGQLGLGATPEQAP